jgi:PXA domain
MSNNPSRASVYPKAPATSTSPITLSHDSPASAALTSQPRTVLNDDKDAPVDKSTIALIRRVLCPQANIYGTTTPRPLQELLPPLTSSNEVDLQLYAIIAIIIKEYVYAWYAKITIDHGFVDEVLRTVAHCTLALEERLRRIDVQQLVLDELPRLVEAHIICEALPSHLPLY